MQKSWANDLKCVLVAKFYNSKDTFLKSYHFTELLELKDIQKII